MDLQLVPFLAVTSVVMLVPGPSVLFAVTQRLRSGPAAGVCAVLGLESGFAIHVGAACIGVSGLIAASDDAAAGAAAGRSGLPGPPRHPALRRRDEDAASAPQRDQPRGLARVFLAGLLVDLLNPKTVLFFVAVLPQFVRRRRRVGQGPVTAPRGCAVAMALCVDGGYAVLAARVVRRGVPAAAARWGRRASGITFCGLAAAVLLG